MNKRKLNKVFAEIKEKANMDYAILRYLSANL